MKIIYVILTFGFSIISVINLMNLNELANDYNDVLLEIDDEVIFYYNTSIPYAYKHDLIYYTDESYKNKLEIESENEDEENKDFGFAFLKKKI